jgi:hypothetical protein
LAGPLGTAIGTGIGGLVGGAFEAIPALYESDAERENKRRLAQLNRQQQLGILGLSEAEKQQLYGAATSQIAGQLQQAQAQARAVGAAGMASGAGAEQLRQAQMAEQQAALAAGVAQNVEAQNLARKRELEGEQQARIAAASQYKQQRLQAVSEGLSGALAGGLESFKQEQTIQGKAPTGAEILQLAKKLNISTADANGVLRYFGSNPDAQKYLELLAGGAS